MTPELLDDDGRADSTAAQLERDSLRKFDPGLFFGLAVEHEVAGGEWFFRTRHAEIGRGRSEDADHVIDPIPIGFVPVEQCRKLTRCKGPEFSVGEMQIVTG